MTPPNKPVHERFQHSEEWLRKMAKAEEECGGFIGAGNTPYNRLVNAICEAQAAEEKEKVDGKEFER